MTATIRRLRGRLGEPESGMVTAFVVIFTVALIVMAGLVLDGGLALAAKVQAIDDAQAAARAGAQAIDLPTYRATGQITLDPAEATADAERYLAAAGHTGTVAVNGEQVTVTVTISQPTQILSLAGIDHLTVTGTGTATAEQGDRPMTRVMRVIKGLSALILLAALVAGIPWALWHFVGWPLPHHVPTAAQVGRALNRQGIPDQALVDALAVVVWITWAILVASIAVEIPAALSGRHAPRLPVAGIFQPVTGRLVAAVIVACLSLAPRPGHTAPAGSECRPVRSWAVGRSPRSSSPTRPSQPAPTRSAPPRRRQPPRNRLPPTAPQPATTSDNLRRPTRRHAVGHRRARARRPAAMVGDLSAQRGPTTTRRGHAHRPPLDRPRVDPRPSHHRHTIFSDTARSPPPRPRRHEPAAPAPTDPAPPATTPTTTAPAASTHPAPVPATPRHLSSDRACWRTGPASLGFGGRRFVRCRGAGHRRYRSAPPPSRLPLPAARTGPRPDPGPDPTDPAPPRADASKPTTRRTSTADRDTAPVFPVDDDERRLDPGWLEIGTRDGAPVTVEVTDLSGVALTGLVVDDVARALVAGLLVRAVPGATEILLTDELAERLLPGLARRPRHCAACDSTDDMAPDRRGGADRPHPTPGLGGRARRHPLPPRQPREPAAAPRRAPRLGTGRIARTVGGTARRRPPPRHRRHLSRRLATRHQPASTLDANGTVTALDGHSADPDHRRCRAVPVAAPTRPPNCSARSTTPTTRPDEDDPDWAEPHGSITPLHNDGDDLQTAHAPDSASWPEPPEARRRAKTGRSSSRCSARSASPSTAKPITSGLRGRARALFAWYLLRPEGATSDEAVDALWPDTDPDQVRRQFWRPFGDLRTRLRSTGDNSLEVLEKIGEHYRPHPAEITCDLWGFQAALGDAARADDDETARARAAPGRRYLPRRPSLRRRLLLGRTGPPRPPPPSPRRPTPPGRTRRPRRAPRAGRRRPRTGHRPGPLRRRALPPAHGPPRRPRPPRRRRPPPGSSSAADSPTSTSTWTRPPPASTAPSPPPTPQRRDRVRLSS